MTPPDDGRIAVYDGLRAVAVLLVVAFHSRLGIAPGGYLGVDVFFVLSGYLITGLLLRELSSEGRIDLVGFWFRRVRRLVPAALVAISGTAVLFALVASVPARQDVIADGRWAALWFSNWHFIAEARDYFRSGLADSPFLHFWSLSVEEQFYFVWPVVVLAAAGVPALRRLARSPWSITLLAVGAAVFAWTLAADSPLRAYYGTDARAYQLLAGAAVAVWFVHPGRRNARVDFLGRAPFVLFETVVVLGATAWITAAGEVAPRDAAIVITLVTLWLLLRLGRISYGVYLWHWPVIVFLDQVFVMTPPTLFAATVFLATGLASASWIFVEQPVQEMSRRIRTRGPRIGTVAAAVASSLIVAFAVVPFALSDRLPLLAAVERPGFTPPRVVPTGPPPSSPVDPIEPEDPSGPDAAGSGDGAEQGTGVPDAGTPVPADLGQVPFDEELASASRCLFGVPASVSECIAVDNGGSRTLILGDSHADRLVPAIVADARANGGTVATVIGFGCPWQSNILAVRSADSPGRLIDQPPDDVLDQSCRDIHEAVLERVIPEFRPDTIIVNGHPMLEPGWRVVPADGSATADEWDAALLGQLTEEAVNAITGADREVVLVLPLPSAPFDVLECLSAVDAIEQCAFVAEDSIDVEVTVLTAAAEAAGGARVVSITDLVCVRAPVCDAIVDATLVRDDAEHLYRGYVEKIAADLVDRIAGE